MVVKAVSRINNSVAIVCLISYKVPKRTDIRHSMKMGCAGMAEQDIRHEIKKRHKKPRLKKQAGVKITAETIMVGSASHF